MPKQRGTSPAAAPAAAKPPAPRAGVRRLAVGAIVALLAAFAGLSWMAVDTKAPAYDEPLHALGAWLHLRDHDFRLNPEDPPLWHYWAAIPNGKGAICMDASSPDYRDLLDDISGEWKVVVDTLYRTEGNDAERFVTRSRAMMLVFGVLLGAVLARWAWETGGTVAAIAATVAYALDPNFLGHAALVKNDVVFALAYATWRAGQRLTIGNAIAIGALCGMGLSVKFSALLLGPIVVLMLVARALLPEPWSIHDRSLLRTRGARMLAAASVCVIAGVVSYVIIWASYGFRFDPTPTPGVGLNTKLMIDASAMNEMKVALGREPTAEEVRAWRPGLFLNTAMVLERNRLLPQAWINGLIYTYQSTVTRKSFLLGNYSTDGWWYYFPVAMLVKTPIATLTAAALALAIFVVAQKRSGATLLREHAWLATCVALPPSVYMLSAMTSNLNIGLRHVLPVYPFVYLAIGLAADWAWRARPHVARVVGGAIVGLLAIESIVAFRNGTYIAFFNAAAGGSRGGIRILGDSNLDWGQDLSLLALWKRDHPGTKLYLSYFGVADPRYYGIDYTNVPGGYQFYAPKPEIPTTPGVIAISATNLQGIYQDRADPRRRLYEFFLNREPIDVLGGTIYLYDLRPQDLIDLHAYLRRGQLPPRLG